MTAVKPQSMLPATPPVPRPAPAPARTGDAQSAFRPGIEARPAPPAPASAGTAQSAAAPSSPATSPAVEGRQRFTLQALSAYAGAIINERGSDPAPPRAQASSRVRTSVAEDPPPRPGGLLDVKV